MSNVLTLTQIKRTYEQGGKKLEVLRGVNFTLKMAEAVALVGPSGSGKTTLLQIAGLLDSPTEGSILVQDEEVNNASDGRRTALRCKSIGFVYQFHHLLPEFSALENVMMPQMIAGLERAKAKKHAAELLKSLGLKKRLHHRPAKLSGGEQQRVAIARALANNPAILLADEPTGNLDPDTAEEVFTHLMEAVKNHHLAALIATHNMELAKRMHRIVKLEHGMVLPS